MTTEPQLHCRRGCHPWDRCHSNQPTTLLPSTRNPFFTPQQHARTLTQVEISTEESGIASGPL